MADHDPGGTQWVESGRNHLGTTALDKIAAVQEKNSTDMTSLQDALNTLKSVVESDARSIVELMDTSSNLNNWAVNQRECYEYLIESVLCQHLSAKGYADIDVEPEKFRKVPFHHNLNGEPMAAVEWDAVITCEFGGKSFLFLVEAKKTLHSTEQLCATTIVTLKSLKYAGETPHGENPSRP